MKKLLTQIFMAVLLVSGSAAYADSLVWRGPTHTLTIGLSQDDISHVEFPEEIVNITVEDQDYVDILVVQGYDNRAFRMRSLLPKMATRVFFTGQSGRTYIVVLTTDVPYRAYLEIVDGTKIEQAQRNLAKKFDANALIRAMANDTDIPGVVRETLVIPNWFKGAGVSFELSEVWQSSLLTGLVVHVKNEREIPSEVNLPAIMIPQTDEWGTLRKAAMENMRLNAAGRPGDKGIMYLVFAR